MRTTAPVHTSPHRGGDEAQVYYETALELAAIKGLWIPNIIHFYKISHWITGKSSPQWSILLLSSLQPLSSLLFTYPINIDLVAILYWVGFWGTTIPHCKDKGLCPHGAYVLAEVCMSACVCISAYMCTCTHMHACAGMGEARSCGRVCILRENAKEILLKAWKNT